MRKMKHGYARGERGTLERRTYVAWQDAKTRCFNPTASNFADYGGRGITMCESWRQSFEAFLAYAGRCPTHGMSLGRIDNNGNYEPGNVRWETSEQQCNNTRRNRLLTHNGRTQNVTQWAREKGWPNQLLTSRLRKGWSIERALTEPRHYSRSASPVASTSLQLLP